MALFRAQMSARKKLAKVVITLPRLHQHRENRFIFQRDLRAHDGANALLIRSLPENGRAIDAIAIAHRHRGQILARSNLSNFLGVRTSPKEAESRAGMEFSVHEC